MGRRKPSFVTRNKWSNRHFIESPTSGFSQHVVGITDILTNMSPSSLHGSAAAKQAKDIDSSGLSVGHKTIHRKRKYSNDDVVFSGHDNTSNDRQEEEEQEQEEEQEMITISRSDLEKWQQRVIFHVEDHFTNEQLKRIAEFGRVHGSIMQEAKDYVNEVEIMSVKQIEKERAALRARAEEFVAKTAAENKSLRQQVTDMTQQIERLETKIDTLEQQIQVIESENRLFCQEKNGR